MAKICFFDLDHTLVRVNITQKFLLSYFLDKPLKFSFKFFSNFPLFLKYKTNPQSLELAHLLIFAFIKDEYEDILQFSKNFGLKLFKKDLFLPVYEELRRAYHLGQKVVIVSAAPDFIVQSIAHSLGGIEAYGTTYEKDVDNRIKIKTILTGEQKANIARQVMAICETDEKNCIAYSDSYQDIELLAMAGEAIVVNPDQKLLKVAKEKNWRVIR